MDRKLWINPFFIFDNYLPMPQVQGPLKSLTKKVLIIHFFLGSQIKLAELNFEERSTKKQKLPQG